MAAAMRRPFRRVPPRVRVRLAMTLGDHLGLVIRHRGRGFAEARQRRRRHQRQRGESGKYMSDAYGSTSMNPFSKLNKPERRGFPPRRLS